MAKIKLIISIDTECDKGLGWKISKPMGFRNITEGLPQNLQPLFEEFGIKPTYLLSPEVIADRESVQFLKSLSNVELGTHLHSEFIAPDENMQTDRTKIPQLALSPEIEQEKLKNLTEKFKSSFGYNPLSFRAGRWGISKHTLRFLEDLEYKVDSSVCSFRTHYFKEGSVNYWGAPLQPYHPSYNDFRKSGTMKLREIPATLGNPNLMQWPSFLLRNLNDRSIIHKKILGKLGRTAQIKWFRPWKSSSEEMTELAANYIKVFEKKQDEVLLNMMFHSNEILPGTSPYAQNTKEINDYLNSLKEVFTYLYSNHKVNSCGLSEA